MSKRTGLGKGLGALFGEEYTDNKTPVVKEEGAPNHSDGELKGENAQQAKQEVKVVEVEKEKYLNISLIEPNSSQPRKMFDEASIKSYGVLQPVLVKKKEDHYELIAGERRWRAAKLAGLREIPVIIREYTKQQTMEIALIENVQREDLNPIEEAQAYKRLLTEFHLKQDEVAERVSKSRTAVTNSMRLLKLCDEVQQMIIDDMITTGHARALISIEDPEQQYTIAQKVFDEKLNVRDVEKLVKNLNKPEKAKKEPVADKALEVVYQDLEEKLKQSLGTKVSIASKGDGAGKLEIEFYTHDDLEKITDLLTGR